MQCIVFSLIGSAPDVGHAAVQTLKGNIRVFCRVKPLATDKLEVESLADGRPVIKLQGTGASKFLASTLCLPACSVFSMEYSSASQDAESPQPTSNVGDDMGLDCRSQE